MKRSVRLLAAISILPLVGCVRTNVSQISGDTAIISAHGSAYNDTGQVIQKMVGEAAALTLKNGYQSFAIIGGDTGYATSYVSTPGYYNSQSNGTATLYGNMVTANGSTSGYYVPPTTSQVQKPTGDIEIKMFHGPCQAGANNCYDAMSVMHAQHPDDPTYAASNAQVASGTTTSSGSGDQLDAFVTSFLNQAYPTDGLGNDRPALIKCAEEAVVRDIPPADRQAMNSSIAAGHYTPEGRDAFARWLGPSAVHGAVKPVNMSDPSTYAGGTPHYQDGTPVDKAAEEPVSRRITANAQALCPDLAQKYPQAFKY